MNILMVAAEFSPLAKTGGLGDATAGLCIALAQRGHDVRLLMPKYAHLPPAGQHATEYVSPGKKFRFLGLQSQAGEPGIYLLETAALDDVAGIYSGDDRDALRFVSLCAASAHLGAALQWTPDIVHCHDWHAGLAPLALRSTPGGPAATGGRINTILTLHNIGYQGEFDEKLLSQHGFGEFADAVAPAGTTGTFNMLRTGIAVADAITTVSPTYAREIQTPEYGMGLEDAIVARRDVLSGRLNGVDYATWDPSCDPYLDRHFGPGDLAGKAHARKALIERSRLSESGREPIVGVVTRLAYQKGIDLFVNALPLLLGTTRARFVILGSGDPQLEKMLDELAQAHPDRIAFTAGYDEALAHLIIAGSDMFLVPSRYEPCGLTQLYALRYGTAPVVRSTGGLADTIEHFDPATNSGNGCVFADADPDAVVWGIRTAEEWFADDNLWSRLMANAMTADFSWQARVPDYEQLYKKVAAQTDDRQTDGASGTAASTR